MKCDKCSGSGFLPDPIPKQPCIVTVAPLNIGEGFREMADMKASTVEATGVDFLYWMRRNVPYGFYKSMICEMEKIGDVRDYGLSK